ncbi:MAG: HAMP domain-containing histidine kinase [Endomicrobia bacterium]|nr:HAMP domain-containing histidine kinase [Endomicrobiia bacterium]
MSKNLAISTRTILELNRDLENEVQERTKKLEIANEQLKEAMEVKTRFTSMVSHELRTPLTAIKEGISIVLDGSAGEINDEQRDFLGTAKRNVDRLLRLINEVLDFVKLEAGKMEFRLSESDINKAIKEVVETQKLVAQQKGLYMKAELAENLPIIKFDYDKIIQVLTNLTNNALKFSEKGGITVSSVLEGGYIKVSVIDTGPGIKEDDLPKVFKEFQQVGDEKYWKPGGTGLGLVICKEIIMNHNGKIWVESKYGEGTKFIFILPVIS